jgi:TonB-linked SusC/RagA family outer membrane protein
MQRLLRLTVLSIGLLFSCAMLHAQNRTISGTITGDKGTPLVGATVAVKGTDRVTATNEQGKFSIMANEGDVLHVTYVGYGAKDFTVGRSTTVAITLSMTSESVMDDIVVVGYGTQKRTNLTGAVSTVNVNQTLGSRPITDVARGLQGAVPGLTITTPTGDIGTNPSIRLRGMAGSLNGGGAQPLILVDNVEMPDLRMLNPDDIESISVLKDAASASIYGTRAAWGVVLITTKSGKKGLDKTSITYSNNFSWGQPTVTPKIAPGVEGAKMAFAALQRANPNLSSFGVVGLYLDSLALVKMQQWQDQYGGQDLGDEMVLGRDFEIRGNRLYFYRTWDAREKFLKDWTPQQRHNLSLTGSSAKTGYNVNVGYLNQSGVLKANPDKFERFNVDLGVNSSVTSWLDARAKVVLSKANKTRPYYFSSETYDPWYYLSRWPAYYPYGTYEGKPFRSALTEVQQAKMTPIEDVYGRITLGGTFKIARGLKFDADYTYVNSNGHEHQTGGSVSAWNFWSGAGQFEYGSYTSTTYDRAIYISDWSNRNVFKAYATYDKSVGSDHDFKLIAGTDVELLQYWTQRTERRGLLSPDFGEPNLATGDQYADNTRGQWATRGYFGRINYAYKNKYLLEVNGRYDGSSRFPVSDQWAFFPSMSAGYVISEESFMDAVKPTISLLKIRGSWGSIGNQEIGANPFLATMPSTTSGWIVGSTNMPTVSTPGLVSPTLTWETVTTTDIGLDARFFNSKFGVSFDWYKRVTSDMLSAGLTVPSSLGTGAPRRNFGELTNKGWELTMDYNHRFNSDFNLNITAVLSDFKETLTSYASNSGKLISSNYEGRTIGEIWGFETDRFFTNDDFEQDANGDLVVVNGKYVLKAGVPTQSRWENATFQYGPGDIKYKDLNGDGVIDIGSNTVSEPGDQKVIGNTTPRYQYGVQIGAGFKNFDLSIFIQGVGKREFWANGPVFVPGYRPGEGWYEHQLDYWTPENPNAYYPRPTDQLQSSSTRNFLPQTKYLLNMAYTRLKNINLGYTFSKDLMKRINLQSARIYISAENILTIDHLNIPIDPEVNYTSAGLNDPNTFGRVYPYRKTLSVGVQITL